MRAQQLLQRRIARLRIDANLASITPFLEAAIIAESDGSLEDAYRYLEDAIENNWKLCEPYVAMVEVALALDRPQEARGYFKQGLDLADDPSELVRVYGKTFGDEIFYVPLPTGRPYVLLVPAYGSSTGNLLAVFDGYFGAFTKGDQALLVVPALANEVPALVARLQPALAGLGYAPENSPEVLVQAVAAGEALRPLIYQAHAVVGGDAADSAAVTIAERLGVRILNDVSPTGFKQIFMPTA